MRLAARPAEELEADLAAAVHPDRPNLTRRLQTDGSPEDERSTSRAMIALGILAAVIVIAIIISSLR